LRIVGEPPRSRAEEGGRRLAYADQKLVSWVVLGQSAWRWPDLSVVREGKAARCGWRAV